MFQHIESKHQEINGLGQYGLLMVSAHSGRHYPAAVLAQVSTDVESLRQLEDPYVDILLESTASLNIEQIYATHARAVVDLNRAPTEIDPKLFHSTGLLPVPTARVKQGLGVVPRIISGQQSIYNRQLPLIEAKRRLETYYFPFHKRVEKSLACMRQKFGYACLLDWHSCPDIMNNGQKCADIILGDCYVTSCAPWLVDAIEVKFKDFGFSVARNEPYAGGYITKNYGKPALNQHAVQIEVNRALYLNQENLELLPQVNVMQYYIKETVLNVLREIEANRLKLYPEGAAIAAE